MTMAIPYKHRSSPKRTSSSSLIISYKLMQLSQLTRPKYWVTACIAITILVVTLICILVIPQQQGNLWLAQEPIPNDRLPCPYPYQRHTLQQVQSGASKPYLFGGAREPHCRNCAVDNLWSHFCQYKSHGQICNPKDVQYLISSYANRSYTQMLTLTPCDMWPYLAGRTLWVIGDSQALDLYKALKCFFFEFWELDSEAPPGQVDNATLGVLGKVLTPSCVTMPHDTRICMVRVDTGKRLVEEVLPLAPKWTSSRDLLLVNFGLHHGVREQYTANLTAFAEYVQQHQHALPSVFWQQTPPQHFVGWQGEYPGGSPPFECKAVANVTVEADGSVRALAPEHEIMQRGGWRNAAAEDVLGPVGIPIVQSFNESLPLYYFHRDNGAGYECTHYCFPSAQQTWVFAFYRALTLRYRGAVADPTAAFVDEQRRGRLLLHA